MQKIAGVFGLLLGLGAAALLLTPAGLIIGVVVWFLFQDQVTSNAAHITMAAMLVLLTLLCMGAGFRAGKTYGAGLEKTGKDTPRNRAIVIMLCVIYLLTAASIVSQRYKNFTEEATQTRLESAQENATLQQQCAALPALLTLQPPVFTLSPDKRSVTSTVTADGMPRGIYIARYSAVSFDKKILASQELQTQNPGTLVFTTTQAELAAAQPKTGNVTCQPVDFTFTLTPLLSEAQEKLRYQCPEYRGEIEREIHWTLSNTVTVHSCNDRDTFTTYEP